MKIDVLYFQGCPNHKPTVELVRGVIEEFGLDADVNEVAVAGAQDVERLRFLGSPSVQIDGVDIDPEARSRTEYAFGCRTYADGTGVPPRRMLVAAMTGDGAGSPGATHKRGRASLAATLGSIATAAMSSACCWGPLALTPLGVSMFGASAFFERWRPLLISMAVVSLGLGYFLTFRQGRARCGACEKRSRFGRLAQISTLAVSTIVVTAFIAFPRYSGALIDALTRSEPAIVDSGSPVDSAPTVTLTYDVAGMSCPACAANLGAELAHVQGVFDASVDYDKHQATVRARSADAGEAVREAAKRLGFEATPRPEEQVEDKRTGAPSQ